MHRVALTLVVLMAVAVAATGAALAQTDEFELPPVKLKPDRPTKAKPIPPSPDVREAPKPEKPKDEPKPEPPAEVAPKPAPKPVAPPKEVPLKPEKPREGDPPTAADLPMPEPRPEPPPAAPETLAQPKTIETPDAPVPAKPTKPQPVEIIPVETTPAKPPTGDALPTAVEPPAVESLPERRATDIQAEATSAQVMPTVRPNLDGLGEVGLVEAVAAARKQYERTLDALKGYYAGRGNATKIGWVDSEMQGFGQAPKPRYLLAAEIAGPDLRPTIRIEAADQLHQEGLHYKNYPAFPPEKKEYLKIALEKFRTIIEKYPQSDKIDEAAFRMGEIYGGWYFQDYARAIQSYQRCWQWNPTTDQAARFNAAKIYEEKLRNRAKAAELYNEVIAHSRNEDLTRQAQERIRALTGR